MDVEDEYIVKDWDSQKEKGTDKQVFYQVQLEIGIYINIKLRLIIIVNVLCIVNFLLMKFNIVFFNFLRKIINNN